jgi:hypothetical protein
MSGHCGGTCLQRMHALEEIGHKVRLVNIRPDYDEKSLLNILIVAKIKSEI